MPPPPPYTTIALVGASGNLGPHILLALLASPHPFALTVISRPSSTSTFPANVRVLRGEYTAEFLASAFKGVDAVVLMLGAGGLGSQKVFVDAAVKAGVKRIVPSEFGGDSTNPMVLETASMFQGKADLVKYIKEVAAEHPSLTWTSVITGPFYDWCLKLGFLSFDLANKKATLFDGGKGEFTTTTLSTIGAAVAALFCEPNKYVNEYLYVSSFTTSQAEILAALKKASGTQDSDWTIENKTVEEYIKSGNDRLAKGDMFGVYDLIFGMVFGGSKYGSDYAKSKKIGNGELGLEKEDLESVTKEILRLEGHVVKS